jgi:hypothetical protein
MPPKVYTLTHLKGYLNRGKIDPVLWMVHFPETLDKKIPTCEDCEDFKTGNCSGGGIPIECFLGQHAESEIFGTLPDRP